MRRRVAVTGLGVICGAGKTAETFGKALAEGTRGFSKLTVPHIAYLKADHAALVGDFSVFPEDEALAAGLDRYIQLALYAGRSALCHAGLNAPLGARAGVVLGTCSGGMLSTEKQAQDRLLGIENLSEIDYLSARYYGAARALAALSGASGPTATVVTACAAGTGASAHGADLIRAGMCDAVLVGGADSFALTTLVGFDGLKAVCEGMCAPFSENIGLNLGEGAAVLVLESFERAAARGATIYAELLGSGLSNDAYHATSPDPSGKGQIAAMARALEDAGISPERVDYVNAHGTGTRANDSVESRAVSRLLGERAASVPMSSTKSMIGHCLGAAGALEAAAVILAARSGILPPTSGFTGAREGCTLDYVPDAGRPFDGSVCLSNSFGFGGNNACLVLDTNPSPQGLQTQIEQTKTPRIVLTGWGAIHPLGMDRPETEPHPKTSITEVPRIPGAAPDSVALVPELDFRRVDRRLDVRNMDRCAKYLTAAARLALEHAELAVRPNIASEIGLVVGQSFGPSEAEAVHVRGVLENDFRLDRVDAFPYVVQNEAAGNAARALLLKGHSTVFSTGWGAGLAALVGAAIGLACGHSRCIVAAAADEVSERVLSDGRAAGIYGESAAVPGEGAAAAVLETLENVSARKSNIYAELLGFGAASDTRSELGQCITGDSATAALSEAIRRAGISGTDVRWTATSKDMGPVSHLEEAALSALCPQAAPLSVDPGLGFAEASLSLLQLCRAVRSASSGEIIAGLSLSREGVAYAAIVRRG